MDPHATRLRSLRVRWAAIGAAVAVTLGAGTIATVDAIQTSGERLTYTAIEPCRLMNTRPGPNQVGPRTAPLPAGSPITVQARGAQGNCSADQLPADAKALQLNVTPVNATASTDITIWPSGPIPQASSLNPRPGPPAPNAVTATLAPDGSFLMQNKFGTIDMVIDVAGFYRDHNHDDRYYTKNESLEVATPTFHRLRTNASGSLGGVKNPIVKLDELAEFTTDGGTIKITWISSVRRTTGTGTCRYQLRLDDEPPVSVGPTGLTGTEVAANGPEIVPVTAVEVFTDVPPGTHTVDLWVFSTFAADCQHNPGTFDRLVLVEDYPDKGSFTFVPAG